jgi:hypothetical protein
MQVALGLFQGFAAPAREGVDWRVAIPAPFRVKRLDSCTPGTISVLTMVPVHPKHRPAL